MLGVLSAAPKLAVSSRRRANDNSCVATCTLAGGAGAAAVDSYAT